MVAETHLEGGEHNQEAFGAGDPAPEDFKVAVEAGADMENPYLIVHE